MALLVRRMRKADGSSWAKMRFNLWDSLSIDEHLGDIDRMSRGTGRIGYIALLPGRELVGFAEVCLRDYANGCAAQPVPFLEGIWIAPMHRRQGIGSALVGKISLDFSARGFHEICSEADIRNRRSHRAHQSWGFAETDRVVCFRKVLRSA